MSSLSSVLLLMVVTRLLGTYMAGVFSLAYAVGQQFQTLGQFETRPYQATDVEKRFSFGTYLGSRIITCSAMILGLAGYAIYSNGLTSDALLLLLVGLLKLFDAFEDVFQGMFQQRGRLDIAGRAFFLRSLMTTVSFCATTFLTRSLLAACIVSLLASLVTMVATNFPPARRYEKISADFSFRPILRLLAACAPLFLSSFLLNDLVNVPRYGIEGVLTKGDQTVYAIIYMPALVINMLVGFLFKPLLTTMAQRWSAGEHRAFAGIIVKGALAIIAATALVCVVAWPLGIPVLSWLYGVDLSAYHTELMVLLVGGAFNALSVILYYSLVTMRLQRLVVVGYAVTAVVSHLVSSTLIAAGGIMGAVLLYDGSMALLAVLFLLALLVGMRLVRNR
jgi:O-antigen/teichoic acid export membrane protein